MDKKKKILIIFGISVVIVLSLLSILMSYLAFKEREHVQQVVVKTEPPEYKIFLPKVPDELEFCGEKVPLYDGDVYERMERELLVNAHWESATILYLKRANRWFPVIEPILKKNGIPNDFKYLSVIESGLSNVVSPAGAVGFWQFMEPAAKKYGLEINKEIDERYNIEKSTYAACAYLKDAYKKYGSWTMAAASYNFGMNGIDKQIERQQTKNYYNLFLVEETDRFIFRLLAIKEIFQNPKYYGFDIKTDDLHEKIETREIVVKKSIKDLASFATENGINYKYLKLFNPWLRSKNLPNKSKKTYIIKIPDDDSINLIEE